MRGANRFDRRALGWLARRLYGRRTAEPPESGRPERVLLVRVDERVGNLLGLQPLLDALGAHWPGLDVGLLSSIRGAQITAGLEGLARIHEIDKRWFFRHPGRWRRVVAAVRTCGYPVAVDLSAWHAFSFTHAALTFYSGAPVRIGYRRDAPGGFHTHPVDPGPAHEHELRQRMRLLAPLGVQADPPRLRTRLGLNAGSNMGAWLADLRVAPPRVGIWMGSRKLERRWPLPFYVQLARRLQQRADATLVALWGPGEEALRDQLAAALPEGLVVAPATDLEELAGLIRQLDLVVTNDTGPMHLAIACGTPTVALFASGDPRRWCHPYPQVRSLSSPGRDPGEVERAAAACLNLLAQRGPAPR